MDPGAASRAWSSGADAVVSVPGRVECGALEGEVRGYVVMRLSDPDGVLIIDDTR